MHQQFTRTLCLSSSSRRTPDREPRPPTALWPSRRTGLAHSFQIRFLCLRRGEPGTGRRRGGGGLRHRHRHSSSSSSNREVQLAVGTAETEPKGRDGIAPASRVLHACPLVSCCFCSETSPLLLCLIPVSIASTAGPAAIILLRPPYCLNPFSNHPLSPYTSIYTVHRQGWSNPFLQPSSSPSLTGSSK